MAKFLWFPNLTVATVSGLLVAIITAGFAWWWASENSDAPCHVNYSLMGAVTDTKSVVRAEEVDGATIYFLDTTNWPGGGALKDVSLVGGGILARSEFRAGQTVVTFPKGSYSTTPMLVKDGNRYWAIHDRKALHTTETNNTLKHEFVCRGGRVRQP